jgi:NAD(P)-dependent dehydrogenase (short-subunit alcohol dehydrogenase family)
VRRLECQVALVTGGTQGIGRAIVELFLAEGARVMSCSRRAKGSEAVWAQIRQELRQDAPLGFCQTDTANVEQIRDLVEATFRQFGAPTILINNAASNFQRHTAEVELDEFARTIDTNVRGYWYLARLLYPHMAKGGAGSIVNVASTQAYQTHRHSFPYNVSKGAVLFLTHAMAVEFGARGIRVNMLTPGFIDTPMGRDWVNQNPDPEKRWQEIYASHRRAAFPPRMRSPRRRSSWPAMILPGSVASRSWSIVGGRSCAAEVHGASGSRGVIAK